ncbi:MAG: IS66 family transposase [Pseudomonadota bacterium]
MEHAALQEEAAGLKKALEEKTTQVLELTQQLEALKSHLVWLAQQVFGRKSEESKKTEPTEKDHEKDREDAPPQATNGSLETASQGDNTAGEGSAGEKRRRGKQKGAKGHGRQRRSNLPFTEIFHPLPPEERCCPICKKPFPVFPGVEESEEIHWEVRLTRHVHKRAIYIPDCDCGAVPGIVTAPPPAKLIPKGLFAADFWVKLILEKFLFQRPLYRIRQLLALEGLDVSQGTLTGGLKRISGLLEPLYAAIIERSRAAHHWQMDETRWMVFVETEGKKGYRWWFWVVVTKDSVVYILDPTRSAQVPKKHLGENAEGILSVDRYSAYKAYKALNNSIRLAFCWAHLRRDFINIGKGYHRLRDWAGDWIEIINSIYHLNGRRLKVVSDPVEFAVRDQALRAAIEAMADAWKEQLTHDKLHPAQKGALESMRNHWLGLIVFVDHPEIPMDNNESERRVRPIAVGRKNYYGSGSVWSGHLSAMLFSILQTVLKNKIDPQVFLLGYFEACAKNRGKPPEDINSFLPWNFSEERKEAWKIKTHGP